MSITYISISMINSDVYYYMIYMYFNDIYVTGL